MHQTFAQVIRTARVSLGYSQRELASRVEIDFTYLSKLESDCTQYPPKEYVVHQLAYYLDLDKDELICLTGRLPERYQDFLKGASNSWGSTKLRITILARIRNQTVD